MDQGYAFHVCRFEAFGAREDPGAVLEAVAQRCRQFQIPFIAADGGGNGHVYNRLLWERLQAKPALFAILYSIADQDPYQDGVLYKWTVNRSATIGAMFSRIKKQRVVFPRVADCGGFLDEFACEMATYDDLNRTIKFTHPATQPDDALHATNYALFLATRLYNSGR